MKVVLNIDENNKNRRILYIVILVICLLAILISAYVLVFRNENVLKPTQHIPASEEEYIKRESAFEEIFSNETFNQLQKEILITNKIKTEDEIIGIAYENNDKMPGKYSLNVTIPYININTNAVKEYNTKIEQIFKQKALDIINNSESKDIVYTVDYVAYVNENNILSIAIRSVLKEGTNAPQRTIIQTYNYDFNKTKEITLEDIMKIKGLNKNDIEDKVTTKIKQEQEKVEELKKLGYNIFERDYKSDIYKVENTTEFFLGADNFLYLIYAYGNDNYTSEHDIVIF